MNIIIIKNLKISKKTYNVKCIICIKNAKYLIGTSGNQFKNQSQIVHWISNGTQFQITNIQIFTHKILPHYFRHQKFQSFIRQVPQISYLQLNMYGFHKVNRKKNSYIFLHKYFSQHHKQNYPLIKRIHKNKLDHKIKNNIHSSLHVDTSLLTFYLPKMAELLTLLIQFNTKNQFDHKKLKTKLDLLTKQVSAKKQRNIRPIIKSIREKTLLLQQIQRKVNTLNWNTLTTLPQNSPTKTTNTQLQLTNPPSNNQKIKKIMSTPIFSLKKQDQQNKGNDCNNGSLNHLYSFGSISSFIALG